MFHDFFTVHHFSLEQPTELQAALAQYLKREKVTVPQVFVQHGAHYLGGCSDIEALHKDGKLVPLLFPVLPTGGAAQVPAQAAAAGGAASSTDSAAATPVCLISLCSSSILCRLSIKCNG